MRSQLKKFTDYTNTLLPDETAYLLSSQAFEDEDRLAILNRVNLNAHEIGQFTPYDTSLDKRKYNHLQNWISGKLAAIDVDVQFSQMMDWEQKIMTDSIQAEDEKKLLKAIKNYEHPVYFFSKFYEIVENYRQFLLIRLRYTDHEMADNFLKEYHASYLQAREVKEKLHRASLDIVQHYSGEGKKSNQWEGWLSELFYDERLEGYIRYLALVRIVFICHNYRKYDSLRAKFDFLEEKIASGQFYSKRILINHYNLRLMLHSHFREYDRAVHYGYLSVRAQTHDYLFYVNNLCAVLLRLGQNQEALQVMQKASGEWKKTKNFHNRIGFVAFHMEALIKNGMIKNAESYGDTYLKAYSREILRYRWHLFFTVYLDSLFHQAKFDKIIRVSKKYKLTDRDKKYSSNANYVPVIPLFIEAAKFRETEINRENFVRFLDQTMANESIMSNATFRTTLSQVMKEMPEVSSSQNGLRWRF